jgi:hypothetical protein
MVKITVAVEVAKAVRVQIFVAITRSQKHKTLESPRPHSLDVLQQNSLILEQRKNLVVIRHDNPLRKTGRVP